MSYNNRHHHSNDQLMGRLVTQLNNGHVANFPAYELRTILAAFVHEYHCCNQKTPQGKCSVSTIIDEVGPPRKKSKMIYSNNNNIHSILKFVQRIINQRYYDCTKNSTKNDDGGNAISFLEDELKQYFGTKDILFQIEEEILCLAFELALNAILQRVDDDKNHDDGGDDCIIIAVALQIIESVVHIDKRERSTRNQLYQSKDDDIKVPMPNASSVTASTDRRKKYEHLLEPKKKSSTTQPKPSCEVKSIMEQKYPRQWKWLCQFRMVLNKKEEAAATKRDELEQMHYPNEAIKKPNNEDSAVDDGEKEKESKDSNFVIIRRRIETLDDISLSSNESDDGEMNQDLDDLDARTQNLESSNDPPSTSHVGESTGMNSESPDAANETSSSLAANPPSPLEKLDQETIDLRLLLIDMPVSESSSAEVIRHTVEQSTNLLSRYGELDGAVGITRCGDILAGQRAISSSDNSPQVEGSSPHNFPLNDTMVASLVKVFLTDAMGALRTNAFLRSFVLPLMLELGKPASRVLASLLASLARDRPTECVLSVIIPTLVSNKTSCEPTRYQCELISRVLKGKDALSLPAITLLVEEVLPKQQEVNNLDDDALSFRGGMKWTDHTMPVLTACLNRQPNLSDNVVLKLADEISYHLSSRASSPSLVKSMKLSTLFHAFVTKYGPQLKSTDRVESLKESSTLLKTFMSKTIGLALKKLS